MRADDRARSTQVEVLRGVQLVHVRNTGVAFGALVRRRPAVVILIAVVALGALLVFFVTPR